MRVGQTVSYTLRKAAFQQITQLPVRYFDTHPAGDLISRVCYDVDTVNAALSTDLLQIGTSLLTVIGSFVMLLMLSPLLSGVFFLTVPLSVLLTRLQMKHIHPLFRRRSQELGALNSFAEERVSASGPFGSTASRRQIFGSSPRKTTPPPRRTTRPTAPARPWGPPSTSSTTSPWRRSVSLVPCCT